MISQRQSIIQISSHQGSFLQPSSRVSVSNNPHPPCSTAIHPQVIGVQILFSVHRCNLSPLLLLWSRTCCSKSSIIIRWCSRLLPKSRPCADIQIPLYIVHSLKTGYQSLNLTICPFACVVSGNSKTRRSMISRVNFFSTYDSQCDQHDSDRRCKHRERKG